MRYRALGRTGLKVSEIGFGAWAIGGAQWGGSDDSRSLNALHRALELGVNFIDTAAAYGGGRSEQVIAKALRGRKDKVFVATKIPPKNGIWPGQAGTPVREVFPARWVREYTEKSLRNLDTDCLDLQQLHVWAPNWVCESEWYEELDKLRGEGKVRFVGVSLNDHAPGQALELVKAGMADTVQVVHNIFDQSPEDELFPLCREKNTGVISRVPLDEGSLTGKLTLDTVFPEGDFRKEYFPKEILKEVVPRVERLKPLFKKEAASLAAGALKYCLSHPAVSTVIPGIRTIEQADANAAASDAPPLSPALLQELKNHRWVRK